MKPRLWLLDKKCSPKRQQLKVFCILVAQRKTLHGYSQVWRVLLLQRAKGLFNPCALWPEFSCVLLWYFYQVLLFWCKTQVWVFQSKFHNRIHESRHGRRGLVLTAEFQQANTTRTNILCDCWFNILFCILRWRKMTLIAATNLPKKGSCSRRRPLLPTSHPPPTERH